MDSPFTINSFAAASTANDGLALTALRERVDRVRGTRTVHGPSDGEAGRNSATHSVVAAVARQSAQLPAFAPLLEELEIAGWSSHRRMLSGNFHDWMLLDNRTLMVVAGQAVAGRAGEGSDSIEAAIVAQGAWATIRAGEPRG